MKFDIIEEIKLKTKLTVRCKIKLKEYAAEKDIKITTKEVLDFLSQNHDICGVLKKDEMWNTPRGNKKNYGTWVFKLKQQIRKTTTEETKAPKKQTQENTEKNFRQRFKNLAKK